MKLTSALAIILPSLALAGIAPPEGSVIIRRVKTSGSGCPQGTVSQILSEDRQVVTLGFDNFGVSIGPGALFDNPRTKNCQIHLDLRYPGGFQYSVVSATYHGFARLDENITGNVFSSYYFSQSATNTASTVARIVGPTDPNGEPFLKDDKIGNPSIVWSPCGAEGILNINNRLSLSPSPDADYSASGEIYEDDATVKFEQICRIVWRQCKKGADSEQDAEIDVSSVD